MSKAKITRYFIPQGAQDEKIESMLKQLELQGAALSLGQTNKVVQTEHGTGYDFLELLLEKELVFREERRVGRWVRDAQFKKVHTLLEYDFSRQPSLDPVQIKEFASCRFIKEGRNIIFLGPNGVGKTHLSVALGVEAINKGFKTCFIQLDKLIQIVEKTDEKSLPRLLRSYLLPRLLILDDIDYYSTDGNASLFLFKLLFDRHENGLSTVLTSNKSISDWAGLFGSRERATAVLDRLVGVADIVMIDGHSYRMKDKLKYDSQLPLATTNEYA